MFHVLDRFELEFPFDRLTLFKGLEKEGDVLLDPNSVRKAYLSELNAYLEEVRRIAVTNRIHYYLINTSEPLDVILSSILTTHGGRRKR
mgnify:CR=1 FL=1